MHSVPNRNCAVFILLALMVSLAGIAGAQGPPTDSPQPATGTDDNWHIAATPYLWFAGVHGTVGALGREASVHASFGDIFNYFNIGFMGAAEVRKKKFAILTDLMWMRLKDEKSLPINEVGIQSADVKIHEFLLTPAVAYRVVDKEKIKIDATAGIRYWHMSQDFTFNPTLIGGVSRSQDWVDALGGARIQLPLSPKATITVLVNAGGGGANSDYQVAGLLGYRISKCCIMQGGWRYLDTNYRAGGSTSFVYDAATSGLLVGVTINLK